ncbi:LRR receptor-like serine/threonine-protein kinase IOS1 [Juglans microcarpa x Juglans regia]|uniref:LRR receptor-like serine/threonine-protein kinase IOS1 n=1 Tax=Juglans microcarpa x Juglans regia TaxID=2249226 RepID=UPI001B7EF1E1|nr:LRR receptor-like serine/threonine-protein kinase IOS1 [Juglans microcarpa x Juglans regia]
MAMRRLQDHPNILKILEVMATKIKIYLVVELATSSELFSKISCRGKLAEPSAQRYFQQLVSALHFCHQNSVTHRDVKPQNLPVQFEDVVSSSWGQFDFISGDFRNNTEQRNGLLLSAEQPLLTARHGLQQKILLLLHSDKDFSGDGGFQTSIFAFLGVLSLILLLVHAQNQSDFISIDCGLPANSTYKDVKTSIDYISDANYIDTGISRNIESELQGTLQQQVWNVRSFPQGVRNCYTINITRGTIYLIRGTFLHGTYDGEGNNLPEFDLYLGTNMWDTVKVENSSYSIIKELIHVASRNYIHVCLVNTGLGTPFISALEFRPLNNNSYETKHGPLALFLRADTGSTSDYEYRYPDDVHDRIWTPYNRIEWKGLSTDHPKIPDSLNDYEPPSVVMKTAATPINESAPMEFNWEADNPNTQFYIHLDFAEVVKLEPNQSRSFNITLNGEYWYGPLVPEYLYAYTLYGITSPESNGSSTYNFSMFKAENSTLPPFLNAVEIYSVKDFLQSETDLEDVDAIRRIKSTYGIKRNWQGDPCAPKNYSWEGLDCSYDGDNAPRITSLNLSSSGLTGEISDHISNLLMLQSLVLSNNSLTGPVHDFLSKLPNLRVLNLERNKLTGLVPLDLIERGESGSLTLSVEENPDLCGSRYCKTKKNNIMIPLIVASIVGGLLIITLIVIMAVFWGLEGEQNRVHAESKTQNVSLESIQRQFTYSQLLRMTKNFERILGKGGFGTVYHGYIDDTQVAVKMLSRSSVQGYLQFQSEVRLLTRVHHRNLTTLFGYCFEGTNMGLIFEYMANGDLEAQLSDGNAKTLTWEDRLRIATETAQGLEYLHCGCKPPIVHRDVKTTNILLNENMQAKLADFGLSKIFPTDGDTHVSTVVAGTPGYLDPEYHITNRLTEKSDVYSFGVVLLKIITGRPAIERSEARTHVSQFVRSMLAKGDIKNIVDPRLHGNFDSNSVWKAIEIAIGCVSPTAVERPTMSQVVADLKECMATELARANEGNSRESKNMVNMDLSSALKSLAR